MARSSLASVADGVARLPRTVVVRAAERFDVIARETASRAVGGTLQLHARRGRRPTVKLKTYTKYAGSGATTRAFVRPKPAGPWRWLEDGTKAHEIGARRTRTGRSRRTAKFLKGGGYAHPVRAPITHHGSRGKRVWSRAIDTFRAEVGDHLIRVTDLRKVVRG